MKRPAAISLLYPGRAVVVCGALQSLVVSFMWNKELLAVLTVHCVAGVAANGEQ
jgi:hypothetical protein